MILYIEENKSIEIETGTHTIGICFEDEFLNVDGRCEPYNDQ